MIKNIKWILIASLGIVSCSQEVEDTSGIEPDVVVSAGTADFTRYVALGNSITAGYSDGALFKAGQMNAYPKLMADQFASVGGGQFKTPFMNDNVGGLLFFGNPNPRFGPRLIFSGGAPVQLNAVPTTEAFSPLTGQFNNMGVPGAKSFHLLAPGYGDPQGLVPVPPTANPYFVRFASGATTSVLADAMAQAPTFFSLWIGNNDVLGYATSGGDPLLDPITPATGAPGVGFDGTYATLIATLTSTGAKGVVASIPDVTSVPYFYVIKYNQLTQDNLTIGGVNQVNALNAQLYGPLHGALDVLGQGNRINLLSTSGNNPMLMVDETLTDLSTSLTAVLQGGGLDVATATYLGQVYGRARQTVPTDLICLTASSRIGKFPTVALDGTTSPNPQSALGVSFPLPDRYVLLPSEVDEIRLATASYNETIEAQASAKGLAFVDAHAILNQLANGGILFGTYHFTNQFVQGGAFGLDGVHLTARANAYIANKFLEAIEKTYGASFKKYKPQDFPLSYPSFLP